QPEVREAVASAAVRVFLAREFADTWTPETMPPELVARSYEKNRAFFKHPELRDGVHVLVAGGTADKAQRPKDEAKDAVARDIAGRFHADVMADPPADRTAFLARAERFRSDAEAAGLLLLPQTLGRFARQGQFLPQFTEVAFKLGVGEISEPSPTKFGWHVIYIDGVEAAKDESLEEAAPAIRERITPQVREAELAKLTGILRARYGAVVDAGPLEALEARRGLPPGGPGSPGP
ncbi:MAG: peptidyl-prolyl cis-trans isomerase, partial [Myxococcales bacterium]|nr:peptidyl-prolyl cis-trans isomerase [Myxococcales bacterium]